MSAMMPEQQQRILGYFIEEAKDHLNTIEQGLLNLQATIEDAEMVNEVFRAAHSVKGGAAMLSLGSIQRTSHRLEDFFKILKETPNTPVDRELESMLLQVFDGLQALLEELQGPFGLTDDKANEVMADLEPVFVTLEHHLSTLVAQAPSTPAAVVPPPATVVSRPPATRSTPVSEDSALKLVFSSDVPGHLREMLTLFKQPDTDTSRTALRSCCEALQRIGEQFDLHSWCVLTQAAAQAVSNQEQTYRFLAPVVIKDLKKAQEQVLSGQADAVRISSELEALLPALATPDPEISDLDALLDDTLAVTDVAPGDLAALLGSETPTTAATEDPLDWLEPSSPAPPEIAAADFSNDFAVAAAGFPETGFGGEAATPNGQEPAVGAAELNSLADLFEGEVAGLDSPWEEISENEAAIADGFGPDIDVSDDFSDLLDSSLEEESNHAQDDLADLFGDATALAGGEATPTNLEADPELTGAGAADDFADLFDLSADATSPAAEAAIELASATGLDALLEAVDATETTTPDDLEQFSTDPATPEVAAAFNDLGDLFEPSQIGTDFPADTALATPIAAGQAAESDPTADLTAASTMATDPETLAEVDEGMSAIAADRAAFEAIDDPWATAESADDDPLDDSALDALDELWTEIHPDDSVTDPSDPSAIADDFSDFADLDLESPNDLESNLSDLAELSVDTALSEPDFGDLFDTDSDPEAEDGPAIGADDRPATDSDPLLDPPSGTVDGLEFDALFDGEGADPLDLDAETDLADPGSWMAAAAPEDLMTDWGTAADSLAEPAFEADLTAEPTSVTDDFLNDLDADFAAFETPPELTADSATGSAVTALDLDLGETDSTASPDSDLAPQLDMEPATIADDDDAWLAPDDDDSDATLVLDLGRFAETADDLSPLETTGEDLGDFLGSTLTATEMAPGTDGEDPFFTMTSAADAPEAPAPTSDFDLESELFSGADVTAGAVAPEAASADIDTFFDTPAPATATTAIEVEDDFLAAETIAADLPNAPEDWNLELAAAPAAASPDEPDWLATDLADMTVDLDLDTDQPADLLDPVEGEIDLDLDFAAEPASTPPLESADVTLTSVSTALSEASFDDLDALLDELPIAISTETDTDFDELDSLLRDDLPTDLNEAVAIAPESDLMTTEEAVDFGELEALLEDDVSPSEADPIAESNGLDEFSDLEKLLEEADQTLGGSSPSLRAKGGGRPPRRMSGMVDQTMRVSVKHLDNLNNLVGELVVNRNSLEQDQERLRQFLDNLLFQVQQLNDVGQRMRDLYERSLLESSLLASRQAFHAGTLSSSRTSDLHGGNGGSDHATGATFDALEMDRFTGFHTLTQEMIELIVRVRESASDIAYTVESTDQIARQFRQVTTQLQEGLNKARMVPFAQTADRLPRAVRDISIKCGKEARLVVEGRDTLIDKMILERLYDPMTHLVNNAITHGVETPDERAAIGKPREGTITVRAFYQGNQTVIYIADDGAGINPDVVKRKAIQKGMLTQAEAAAMSTLETYELLFRHGFTTRDKADDFAGRGVGMDVVRTALSEIRGSITIDSQLGKGTSFTIRLPLTLSISKALSCLNNQARIAFPMDGVEDMFDVPKDRIQTDQHNHTCIPWRDTLLTFQPLSELLQFNRALGRGRVYGGSQDEDIVSIVVLRSANTFIGVQVDRVLGEQEIVIKQIEGPVPKPMGIAGATVLGDGRVMPIGDVLELIDIAQGRVRREAGSSLWSQVDLPPEEAVVPAKSEPTVLIVDDSITVRELLSMSFNKVGYRVEQARDGQEAWEKLRSGLPCDLVFCDIEMPRMDGLELLSRMQKDGILKRIPIAMLTSRGADRHRQMAVDLGASGYFTKPYLEEALLDAAQRMLNGEVLLTRHENEEE